MSNKTTISSVLSAETSFTAYYPLTLIIVGTLLNLFTFIILWRPAFRDTKKRPTIHYMRAIAIFDIFMLYGWNLEHYLSIVHGFTLLKYSIVSCKLMAFFSFFIPETSAWLRVFICLDRYMALSRLHRTWFSHSKSVLIIIACIVLFFILFNFHFFLFVCFYESNGTINVNSWLYTIYPLWDNINLIVYNCLPLLFMIAFNSGVVYHLNNLRRTTIIQNSRIQHRAISISLLLTTILFLIMTIPASVAYAFYTTTANPIVLHVLDSVLYTYHITSFPLYFVTFDEFRRECIAMVTCKPAVRRVAPMAVTPN